MEVLYNDKHASLLHHGFIYNRKMFLQTFKANFVKKNYGRN